MYWWLTQLFGVVSFNSVMNKKKGNARTKPLPPSKRLRLEAQRVLKERVQDIADKKGIKLRFCNLKECESHIQSLDSPCENTRTEIGWPQGVPFVHPHDLPNKAKLGFLEAYEPGWAASQQEMELSFTEPWWVNSHFNFLIGKGTIVLLRFQNCFFTIRRFTFQASSLTYPILLGFSLKKDLLLLCNVQVGQPLGTLGIRNIYFLCFISPLALWISRWSLQPVSKPNCSTIPLHPGKVWNLYWFSLVLCPGVSVTPKKNCSWMAPT